MESFRISGTAQAWLHVTQTRNLHFAHLASHPHQNPG
jgi:hypothetical protein